MNNFKENKTPHNLLKISGIMWEFFIDFLKVYKNS